MSGKKKIKDPVLSKIFLLLSLCQMVTMISLFAIMISEHNRPPLQCIMKPPDKAIETYCYIQGLFTVENPHSPHSSPNNYNYYPGVGPKMTKESKEKYHAYFFWIPYLLFFQILLFAFPRQLWEFLEGGLDQSLTGNEDDILKEEPKKIRYKKVKRVIYFYSTLHWNKRRAFIFLMCEAVGVATVFINIFFTNWYLEGKFLNAIPELLANILKVDEIDDIYDNLFPKLSKCSFFMFGRSGTIIKRDALCVLTRNLLSGRIYTLHFAVFSVAALICLSSFLLRVVVFMSPRLREIYLIKKMSKPEGSKDDVRYVLKFCDFGDWFLLLQLACSMPDFHLWLSQLRVHLQERNRNSLWRTINAEQGES